MSRPYSNEAPRAVGEFANSIPANGVNQRAAYVCHRLGRHLRVALLVSPLTWNASVLAQDPAAVLGGLPKMLEAPKSAEAPKPAPALKPPLVEYYVALDEKQGGPFVCQKLLELAKTHQLTPETRIWRAGFTTWRRAGSDPWFDPIFASVPPPVNGELPKLREDKLLEATPCVDKPPPPEEKPWWKSLLQLVLPF